MDRSAASGKGETSLTAGSRSAGARILVDRERPFRPGDEARTGRGQARPGRIQRHRGQPGTRWAVQVETEADRRQRVRPCVPPGHADGSVRRAEDDPGGVNGTGEEEKYGSADARRCGKRTAVRRSRRFGERGWRIARSPRRAGRRRSRRPPVLRGGPAAILASPGGQAVAGVPAANPSTNSRARRSRSAYCASRSASVTASPTRRLPSASTLCGRSSASVSRPTVEWEKPQ